MLDVHPPHEPVHGWRDFLLHILTITIGLLIALGLEGLVEWRHHRHLLHSAEHALHDEIQSNAAALPAMRDAVHRQQAELRHDTDILDYILQHGRQPEGAHTSLSFAVSSFDEVSWRTAQISGALPFMDYARAQQYANLYAEQEQFRIAEQDASRDAILCLAALTNTTPNNPDPYHGTAPAVEEKIAIYQGQLLLIDSILQGLEKDYKTFQSTPTP